MLLRGVALLRAAERGAARPTGCCQRLALDVPVGLDRVEEVRRLLDLQAVVVVGVVRVAVQKRQAPVKTPVRPLLKSPAIAP